MLDGLELARPALFHSLRNPDVIGYVGERHKARSADFKPGAFFELVIAKADARLVRFHQVPDRPGQLVTGLPADCVMPDFSPILIVTEAPVPHDLYVERLTDRGEESAQSIGAPFSIGEDHSLTAPLHGYGPEPARANTLFHKRLCVFKIAVGVCARRFFRRIVERSVPESPGCVTVYSF